MLSTLSNLIHRPNIQVRIPNDDSTFNPAEYPNLAFHGTGKLSGKIRLVHGNDDGSGMGLISTRIYVARESDKKDVVIHPAFDNKTHTFTLEAPSGFTAPSIYHETVIIIPTCTNYMATMNLECPNSSLKGETLQALTFGSIRSLLSNSSITLEGLQADQIDLKTSNASISGSMEAGQLKLSTTNGSISIKARLHDPQDRALQSLVSTTTSNASIHLHVDATESSTGLWMENLSSNGSLTIGALIAKASKASFIHARTNNARVDLNVDASQSGQPLEVVTRTGNGSTVASIMVPREQPFKGSITTSNSSVVCNLTEDFQGQFDVSTSNCSASVEGSDLNIDLDKKAAKHGMRGHGPSQINVQTSNSSASLRFYPTGESLANNYGAYEKN